MQGQRIPVSHGALILAAVYIWMNVWAGFAHTHGSPATTPCHEDAAGYYASHSEHADRHHCAACVWTSSSRSEEPRVQGLAVVNSEDTDALPQTVPAVASTHLISVSPRAPPTA